MNRDDIIRMAREAGLASIYSACDEPGVRYAYEDWDEELERFAALVAATEREACAQLCDPYIDSPSDHEAGTAESIQDAIRARGTL